MNSKSTDELGYAARHLLEYLLTERKAETLRRGCREMPTWVFCTSTGTMLDKGNVVFVRLLKRAKLPLHFSPHSLRHTFASLLLQQGERPVHVQRQLGHASIKLTVDTYGKWLPMGNRPRWTTSMTSPREQMVAKVVAKLVPAGEAAAQRLEKLVSRAGLEPATPCLKGRCSTN